MANVLITGASRGLGLKLTIKYLEKGFHVFACARNIHSDLLAEAKKKYGNSLTLVTMDVSITESVVEAAQQVREMTQALDIIINNAAIHFPDTNNRLEDTDIDHFLETLNVNAAGPMRVAKEFVALLDNGSMKKLINISSEAGSIADSKRDRQFAYCASKAALNMENKILYNYLSKRGISVLAIHPGWMRTDMGGANADISADEAADGIIEIIGQNNASNHETLYMDYTGKPLNY